MNAKQFLTPDERADLIEAYATDKLNNPPANISDKTLITNYGNDGQKGRLELENFDVRMLTDPDFKTAVPVENPTPNPIPVPVADNAGTDAGLVTGNNGANVGEYGTDFVEGATVQQPVEDSKELEKADADAAQHATDINNYIRATGKRPFSDWTPQQLRDEMLRLESETNEAVKAKLNAQQNAATVREPIEESEIRLKHKDGREIIVTKHTYNEFIKKNQPEWSPVVETPKELL